ncbi:segregation and condensation protein A [Calditrichota bacterium]
MTYKIKLDIFEGPFDLLLFLIKKHEVDIYDIPIHEITEQFLEYLELMKMLDLEIAGEFIEMVAILMNVKARMLLPKPVGISDEEYEDPRTELVERLIEYQKFKEASSELAEFESNRRKLFSRKNLPKSSTPKEITVEEYLNDVSLFDLLLALKKALDNMPKITEHQVKRIDVTLEQQTEYIIKKITQTTVVLFSELIKKMSDKIRIIVTFMALLDLINKKRIIVRQSEAFDDIRIKLAETDNQNLNKNSTSDEVKN